MLGFVSTSFTPGFQLPNIYTAIVIRFTTEIADYKDKYYLKRLIEALRHIRNNINEVNIRFNKLRAIRRVIDI